MTLKYTTQEAFAFGDDDGSLAAHTLDAKDTNRSSQDTGVNFILRIIVEETNNKLDNMSPALEYSYDGGGWTDVSGVSTHVFANASGTWSDNDAVTAARVSYTGTFVNGYADSDGVPDTTVAIKNQYTEVVFCLQVPNTAAYDGKVIQLRVAGLDNWSITPQITVNYAEPPAALTVADIAHSNALDSPTLTSHNDLTVQDIAHSNALDPVILTSGNTLTVQDILHGNALDPVVLVYYAQAQTQDILHDHLLDSPTLISNNTLVVQEILHDNTLDPVALLSGNTLTVAEIAHAHALDEPVLTYNPPGGETLVVQEVSHTNTLDGTTLTSHDVLTTSDIEHSHSLDEPILTFLPAGSLVAQDVVHDHSLDSPELVFTPASESLVVADIGHTHQTDVAVLTSHNAITVADISHAHELDSPVLTFIPLLVMDDIVHDNSLDSVLLTHIPPPVELAVDDIIHTHVLDGLRFGGGVVSFMHDHDDFFIFMT